VPRDRDASFDAVIVKKRQRRLDGIDEIVLSLTARGLTTGEVAAHFDEVYGAKVSRDTISRITDKVLEQTRPQNPSVAPKQRSPESSPRAIPPRGLSLPRRVEFRGDPPPATVVVALALAVVRGHSGRVLLARCTDTGNWELPGGAIEPGETATAAAEREVLEETGVAIHHRGRARRGVL
jgi:hypothetical protein